MEQRVIAKVCFAAEGIIRDAQTNQISAFNIIENITAAGLPTLIPRLAFFTLWEREAADPERINGRFNVHIGSDRIVDLAMFADFQGNVPRTRTMINMGGLMLPRAGILRFRMEMDNGNSSQYEVEILPPPPNANQPVVQQRQ
jgi:hypothetical protein